MNCRILFFILLSALFTMPLQAEYIFLKDGAIINGQIINDSVNSLTVRDNDKKISTIPRGSIMRILFTKLYLGKIFVQKIDGKSEICYMVDEDQDSYTFRKELYNPSEFTLRRDQVLFIARGNPTGLTGETGTVSAALKWFPPYNPVKKYRINIKGPEDKEFRTADETGSNDIVIKNLRSNTRYLINVTAIDAAGDESLPSNELAVTTLNVKPDRPKELRHEKRSSEKNEMKNGKKIRTESIKHLLVWDEVRDIDGTIKHYNIYLNKDDRDEKLTEVKKNEFEIPEDLSVYKLRVSAVDDRDDESPASRLRHPKELKAGIRPLYFVPQGKYAKMYDPGYGALLSLSLKNFIIQNLEPGISAGAVFLPGTNSDRFSDMTLVPVTVDARYHFAVSDLLTVMPFISAGYSYMDINYISLYRDKNKKGFEPFFRAGAAVNLEMENCSFTAGADYGTIYEVSEIKPFFEVFVSAGVMFDI